MFYKHNKVNTYFKIFFLVYEKFILLYLFIVYVKV